MQEAAPGSKSMKFQDGLNNMFKPFIAQPVSHSAVGSVLREMPNHIFKKFISYQYNFFFSVKNLG
jgi:hypothetical protein